MLLVGLAFPLFPLRRVYHFVPVSNQVGEVDTHVKSVVLLNEMESVVKSQLVDEIYVFGKWRWKGWSWGWGREGGWIDGRRSLESKFG